MSILKGQIKRHDNGTALTDTILYPETIEDVVQKFDSFDNSAYLLKATPTDKVKGSYERLNKLVGGTIAWNQLVQNGNFTNGKQNWYTPTGSTVASGILSFIAPSQWGGILQEIKIPQGHRVLLSLKIKTTTASRSVQVTLQHSGGTAMQIYAESTTEWQILEVVSYIDGGDTINLQVKDGRAKNRDEIYVTDIQCFDLTQMFGSTIANYIYSLEQANAGAGVAWFKELFPKPYYEYNAGELVSVKTSAHEMTGFNLFDSHSDIESTFSSYANSLSNSAMLRVLNTLRQIQKLHQPVYYKIDATESTSGAGILTTGTIRCYAGITNVFQLTPNIINTAILTADLSNVTSISIYGTQPAKSITFSNAIINLSHSGYRNGEYEPYVKHTYALDSDLELRGIPKLDANNELYYDGDECASDGTVTRKYGIVDLGTLTWSYYDYGGVNGFNSASVSSLIKRSENCICSKYITNMDDISFNSNTIDLEITINKFGSVKVKNNAFTDADSFKTAMSGVYLVYELATPTTETADPYEATEKVDAYGTESFIDYRPVPMPVYTETNYLSDLSSSLYEEFDIQNHITHNLPIVSKTYPAYTITANDTNNGYLYFGTVDINDKSNFYKPWGVHYRVTVNTTTAQCNGTYDVFYGVNGTTINYSIFNNFYSTSYYPIYYHLLLYPKSASYIDKQAHFGVRIQSAYSPTTLAREIKVEVIECFGCTVTLKDKIVLYKDLYNSTYFTSGTYNATSLGLQETGDSEAGQYYLRYYSTKAQTAITAGKLIVGSDSGYSHLSPSVAFDLKYPILYAPSAISAGNTGQNYKFHYAINLTTTQSITLTAYKAVYLVGTLNGTMFTPDTTMFTQTIPTTVNNKVYKYIGHAYNTTNISFDATDDRLYAFYNGKFQEIVNGALTIKTNPGVSQTGMIPIIGSDGEVYTYATATGSFDSVSELTLSGVKVPWGDITDKPPISVVNNATLSLQANGTTKTTFYANDATNKTFNIANGTSTTGNGTISVGGAAVSVYGLKSAAYTDISAYVPTSRTINGIGLSSNVSLYKLVTHGDNRSVNTTPNDYANVLSFEGLKNNSTIGITSEGVPTYSYLVGLRGWSDSSGGNAWELAFNNKGINVRNGATTTWGAWDKLLTESRTINGKALSDNVTLYGNDIKADDNPASITLNDWISNVQSSIPTIPNITIATATGSGSIISGLSASGHTITPAKSNLSTIINNDLSTGTSTPVDADYFISQYVNGGTSNTTYYRRPISTLWTYIKSKADNVYIPTYHYYTTVDLASGWYKIKINATNSWMLAFTIRLYQNYTWNDIIISGYNYGTNYWYSPTARLMGDSDSIEVKFGYDSTWNLWVAVPRNRYTGLDIFNVTNGYMQVTDKTNLFTITSVDTLTGTTQSSLTLNNKYATYSHTHTISQITDFPTDLVTSYTPTAQVQNIAVFGASGTLIGDSGVNISDVITSSTITPYLTNQKVNTDNVSDFGNTSTITLKAGSNVTVTGDNTNKTITITATNTKNTAGSTNTSNKIFLVGATSQDDNPQTYSHDTAYVGTDGCLYSGGAKVLTSHQSLSGYVRTSRTINAKQLDNDVILYGSDIKADDNPASITLNDWISNIQSSIPTIPSNNITGSGTSGYIAKFNGTYTITNGPAFGSSTTTYLRNDGSWATPPNSDTKNTAGSTDTSSKIFLIGAISQAANPQTYSHDTAYVGTDGCLYSGGAKVLTSHQSLSGYVPTSRKINNVPLTNDVNLTAMDITMDGTVGGTTIYDAYDSKQDKITAGTGLSFNGKTLNHSNIIEAVTTAGLYKIKYDTQGHITGTTAVAKSDITALGIPGSDTNTTYTFAGGTNQFTVTPSGGTAQTITITPSITNNITGSGTSGYLVKFNGTNTITNGPQLGTGTTTYLRNDGSWATPPNSDTKNTAGATNTSNKIFLIGAQSQTDNPQTYSHDTAFVDTDGCLYSGGAKVLTSQSLAGYLPLSGGTMTGTLLLKDNQYYPSSTYGLNCQNSDIIGLNSIYTSDLADTTSEGIHFYRDSSHWDTLTASGGTLYFMANDTLSGTAFTSTNIKKVEFQGHTHTKSQITDRIVTSYAPDVGVSQHIAVFGADGTLIGDSGVNISDVITTSTITPYLTNQKVNTDNVSDFGNNSTITFKSGSNVTVTGNNTNKTITISSTDTKNTAGSTNTTSKIFLIGATSQDTYAQTYSNSNVFVTNGEVTANSYKVTANATISYNTSSGCLEIIC